MSSFKDLVIRIMTPAHLTVKFEPIEFSTSFIESQIESIEYYHPFGNAKKFTQIEAKENKVTFQDHMKGTLMGKYKIQLDSKNKEAIFQVEYSKGVMTFYGGMITFFLIGLMTGLGFQYFWVGLFFGSPSIYFLLRLRNAEKRRHVLAKKEAIAIISRLSSTRNPDSQRLT